MPKLSPYAIHKKRWKGCERCNLCENRSNVVLARGELPCDILFVGEAPGPSENTLGRPFIGPAGKLLDRIIEAARGSYRARLAWTNLVGCIPLGDDSKKFDEPPKEAIEACAPRLRELVAIAKPKVIVTVGTLADKWTPKILGELYDSERLRGAKPTATSRSDVGGKPKPLERGLVTTDVRGIGPVPKYLSVIHPAAILRMDPAQKPLAIKRSEVAIREAFHFV